MRYLIKIYIGTAFPNDEGTNVAVKVTAENEEQAVERALSLLKIDRLDYMVYETEQLK